MRSKKLSLTISLFVAVLGLCIGLAGCDSFLHTHAFSPWATVSPPSCTAAGIQERTCACGASESAPVPATGHTVATDPAVDPSCTEEGKTEGSHCAVCGAVLVGQNSIAPLEHTYELWYVTKDATATQEGERARGCTRCGEIEYGTLDVLRYDGSLGSAGKISGKTVIVSVFANDSETRWDPDSDIDNDTMDTMHKNLGIAVAWLKEQCQAYGADPEFIYDWKTNPDLYYTADFSVTSMIRSDGGGYGAQCYFIGSNVDSVALKQDYHAENIIYILYFNAKETNTINSWCLSDISGCPVEVINIFVRDRMGDSIYLNPPSSFAHELLHCFGAYDLYYANEAIPQAYVDHCREAGSNDIMYTVNLGNKIRSDFTELCAYYVGLTNHCAEVDTWGLGQSTHLQKEIPSYKS